MLHFEIAGRQLRRRTALRRNGIKMKPAGFFPGERQPVAIGPVKLIGRDHGHNARTFIGMPHLASGAGRDIGDADGPWSEGFTLRTCASRAIDACGANERHAATVDAPHRVAVAIGGRVQIFERFIGTRIHLNQCMVATIADKHQAAAIGRPAQGVRTRLAVHRLDRLFAALHGGYENLVITHISDVAVSRNLRRTSVRDFLRRAAVEWNDVNRLIGAFALRLRGLGLSRPICSRSPPRT